MKIDQGDLLWGMSMIFVHEFKKNSVKELHNKGDFIFREGDKADYFYTLIEGDVKLSIGDAGREVYTVIKQNLVRLRRRLPMGAGILIVGGAIRNIIIELIHGNAPETNDIDLFISGIPGDYPLGIDWQA